MIRMLMEMRALARERTESAMRQAVSADARALYHEAFALYGPLCFWSTREMQDPTVADVPDAVPRLKRNGNMTTRQFAVRLEEACRAAS